MFINCLLTCLFTSGLEELLRLNRVSPQHFRWRIGGGFEFVRVRVTAAAGHVLNLLLILRVLAARAFRGLRILLLALGLVLNQPLFDRLLAPSLRLKASGFIDCSVS